MWTAHVHLNDGRLMEYDVAAETEAQARLEARAEFMGEMNIDEDKPWLADTMIRCIVVGRS